MNAVTVDGKTVTQCFELVSQVTKEVEGLCGILPEMITKALSREKKSLPCNLVDIDFTNDLGYEDSGWVMTDTAYSFPLKGRGKKKTQAYIGFQISLMGDGIAIPSNNEPLLHVFLWGDSCSFEEESYLNFPIADDENDPQLRVVNDRLLLWGDKELDWGTEGLEWNQFQWSYSLRLMALNSPEDLKKHIIEPMLILLGGGDVMSALPDSLPALVKYPDIEQLITLK